MYKGIKEAIEDYKLNHKKYEFKKLKFSDEIILMRGDSHYFIDYSNTSLSFL